MYPVTKPILPDPVRYGELINKAHERSWLTNFGPLHEELTQRLKEYLGVEHMLLVANGTLALQVAYKALNLTGKVLTTPFSFIATTSSLTWEGLQPVFVDIDAATFNIDPQLLHQAPAASALVAVHVFGNPCSVEAIEHFAAVRRIPVIYDAAHGFGTRLKGQSVLVHGDASTLSFHATKLFHTVEGGAVIFKDEDRYREARALINFGQREGQVPLPLGINAKLSEYHAAAGLTLLDRMEEVLEHRAHLVDVYQRALRGYVEFQKWSDDSQPNGSYMPILLRDDTQVCLVQQRLAREGVQTRRYFYPSLNQLPWRVHRPNACDVSESVASRVLCLPLYADLTAADVRHITDKLMAALR